MDGLPRECLRRYQAVRRIASGGYGEVWQASQVALGRQVAIKLLRVAGLESPETRQRFSAEARITASLSHPNVVQVLDHGADDEVPWIAFELVTGECLRATLAAGPLEPARALDVVMQVAGALDAAHALGILHRDVKPDNLMYAEGGRVSWWRSRTN